MGGNLWMMAVSLLFCWQSWLTSPLPNLGISPPALASLHLAPTSSAIVGSLLSFPGTPPSNLGIKAGKLAPCPSTPNCVSSQSQDAQHKIDPLPYTGNPKAAFADLKTVVEQQERTHIVKATDTYLYAEFTTPLLGFVDDVEFWLDRAHRVIQVRSASRLGESDLGVNRKRIEHIRHQWQRQHQT
ncbi:DUF1499 domain-containing protein [Trichothermofontia sp.]